MSTSENVEIVGENYGDTSIPSSVNVESASTPVTASPTALIPPSLEPSLGKPPLGDPAQKRRKLTSEVWNHFEKKNINGEDVAICNYCNNSLKANSKNGTKALKNHLGSCSSKKNSTIESCFEKQKQLSVERKSDGKVRFGNFTFDQEISRQELAASIILHEYPISIVDHIGFKRFVSSLQPLFKMVSRNTIKDDILKIYNVEKAKLQKVFERLKSRIALTTDMWTSNQRKGYMSITAHFLDDSWTLQSRLLRFVYVPAPHTMHVLAQEMMDALTKWNIETKISTITVDNCSSNDGMISIISEKLCSELLLDGKIFHMRCSAHILNLVVKEGLSIIEDSIEIIRDSVAFWSASPSRVEKFEEVARQAKVTCSKKLTLDCRTRWNSTYLMLETAIEYKDLFHRLKLRDKYYTFVPSEKDWEMATIIAEKLKIFYKATEIFSGTKYPTANVYFIEICQIRNAIVKWMSFDNEVIRAMAKKMFDKFEKYWKIIHTVLSVAVVLDPRYKMKVVDFYFPGIYGDDGAYEIEQVKKTCYDLLSEYQFRFSRAKSNSSSSMSSIQASCVPPSDDLSQLVAYLSSSSTDVHVKSELDHYLDEPVLPWTQVFDILNWWKTNGIKYPTLQMIARDFLAIPISTVAPELAFSTDGRVVSNHRSRLHPDTLEALMCSQNWLKSSFEGK